jgi:hypothetical protein
VLLVKRLSAGKNKLIVTLTLLPLIATACSLICPCSTAPDEDLEKEAKKTVKAMPPKGDVIYSLDFAQNSRDDARKWLEKKDFEFKRAAGSQDRLSLTFAKGAMVLEAKDKLFGLIINGKLHLDYPKKIRITWGVDAYPKGASYEKKVNNESIMVYVYFGNEKMSSGSLIIPNSPFFIGLFLGENDKINKPYIGRYFSKGGRFICLANPKQGETITSEFDLGKGFKECFGKDKIAPFISGLALEVETSSTGPSKAFIKKIEILN